MFTRHQSILASPPEGLLIKSRDHLLAMNASPSSIACTLLEEKYRAVNFLLTDNYWLKVQCLAELMRFNTKKRSLEALNAENLPIHNAGEHSSPPPPKRFLEVACQETLENT